MAVHNITVWGTVSSDGKSLPGAEVHASIDTGAKGGLIWKDAVTGPDGAWTTSPDLKARGPFMPGTRKSTPPR